MAHTPREVAAEGPLRLFPSLALALVGSQYQETRKKKGVFCNVFTLIYTSTIKIHHDAQLQAIWVGKAPVSCIVTNRRHGLELENTKYGLFSVGGAAIGGSGAGSCLG